MAVFDFEPGAALLTATAIFGLCGAPLSCAAEVAIAAPSANSASAPGFLHDARTLLIESTTRVEALLTDAGKKMRAGSTDWLRWRSGFDPLTSDAGSDDRGARLVVQEDRPDGTDVVTVRFVRGNPGSVQPYAGAGINRAQYFGATEPTWLSPRNRYGAVGAAAEAGAELRVSERLLFTADLRWADKEDANALRGQNGPVAADPLVLGLTVGYRFR